MLRILRISRKIKYRMIVFMESMKMMVKTIQMLTNSLFNLAIKEVLENQVGSFDVESVKLVVRLSLTFQHCNCWLDLIMLPLNVFIDMSLTNVALWRFFQRKFFLPISQSISVFFMTQNWSERVRAPSASFRHDGTTIIIDIFSSSFFLLPPSLFFQKGLS